MDQLEDEKRQSGALARSKDVAVRLSVAARKLRFSTSGRSALYRVVGLRPRAIDRWFAVLLATSILAIVAVPNVLSIAYFGILAADRYQSEARFTVRPASPALGEDQIGSATGLPSVKIVQDTQIVTTFIESQDALAAIGKTVDLVAIYNSPRADVWARLGDNPTAEHMLRYWRDKTSVSISPSSGIVTVSVQAFSPEEARTVLLALMANAEQVVNGVNDRIWQDVLATAQANLDHASTRLSDAQVALSKARSESGVLSVESSAQMLTSVITTLQQETLSLEQRYNAQLSVVSADAPQMRALKREIDAKASQLESLNSQITGSNEGRSNLADISEEFTRAQLDVSLAEKQFAASVATYEQVQFVSRQQLVYLDAFLPPTLPQSSELPRRWLWIGAVLVASLAAWMVLYGLLLAWRNRFDR